MSFRRWRAVAAGLFLLQGLACGPAAPKAPTSDAVLLLLRQEAESMKRDGEKVDPALGVKATWNIDAIDVAERPGDKDKPWNGTVRFRIQAETRDGNSSHTDSFDKTYQYAFDAATSRWQMR